MPDTSANTQHPGTPQSMTAFAAGRGNALGHDWAWELRSVNGKGLDLRLRVPDWITGLEAALRARLSAALGRGNVTLSLRVSSAEAGGRMAVNTAQLDAALDAMAEVEARAMARGLSLAPARPGDILALRGVLETASADTDTEALSAALLADFDAVLGDFLAMRADEGAALAALLGAHLDEIARLTASAAKVAEARRPEAAAALTAALSRVMEDASGADPDRVAQELAMMAVKADITEEIGRLDAHVAAARALLAHDGPVGRKLDFLSQEFNREANTLCSKAGSSALTAVGLELKAAVDQLREQVQNVE
ncbi:TIGR00255 family protein [Roseovarius nanhaiticus]|uniref:TIGR00255 family protein n=1 Tax=Roseovarius nanhaiticus TaxID=573024 RepID=A0A1N7GG94_9RHOB|nr:YicC/YloC family endoribonuclease [Roseovarius nanhaiticus]SEK27076.1 TIGR00255 family protein [Roseovarius nanhaiticus]SIS11529.1 TIGR00255 family protein [Roseovarius nanhaiticus]